MSVKQAIKRSLSTRGQFCVPAEFRSDDVTGYVVTKATDEQGREHLKLYPIEREDSDDE